MTSACHGSRTEPAQRDGERHGRQIRRQPAEAADEPRFVAEQVIAVRARHSTTSSSSTVATRSSRSPSVTEFDASYSAFKISSFRRRSPIPAGPACRRACNWSLRPATSMLAARAGLSRSPRRRRSASPCPFDQPALQQRLQRLQCRDTTSRTGPSRPALSAFRKSARPHRNDIAGLRRRAEHGDVAVAAAVPVRPLRLVRTPVRVSGAINWLNSPSSSSIRPSPRSIPGPTDEPSAFPKSSRNSAARRIRRRPAEIRTRRGLRPTAAIGPLPRRLRTGAGEARRGSDRSGVGIVPERRGRPVRPRVTGPVRSSAVDAFEIDAGRGCRPARNRRRDDGTGARQRR